MTLVRAMWAVKNCSETKECWLINDKIPCSFMLCYFAHQSVYSAPPLPNVPRKNAQVLSNENSVQS